jgi:hypothetical protein
VTNLKLIREGRRTWPVEGDARGTATDHKTVNAAKRYVRSLKLGTFECWTVAALKRNGKAVPA